MLLAVAVVAVSLGPGTLRELVSGLAFHRPPAAGITSRPVHADPELQARVEAVARELHGGRLATMVIDLQTGGSASLDAERAYPAASLFKLPVLLEVLARQDAGALQPDAELEVRPEDWTDGSGVLQARIGERIPIRELTRLMIQESDNVAALVLLHAVGVANVNATAQRLGMRSTRLVDHRAGDPSDHTTSAADMARLLVALASGSAINPRVSEAALSVLELKQSVNWLTSGLPFWVKVAHKWGDLPQARNDAGVVFTPRGSYVVAVLTEDGPAEDAANTIAAISHTAYDYLGARRG